MRGGSGESLTLNASFQNIAEDDHAEARIMAGTKQRKKVRSGEERIKELMPPKMSEIEE